MATQHVFYLYSSVEETRPQIDFTMNQLRGGVDWGLIASVFYNEISETAYRPARIVIDDPDAAQWDFYRCPGTPGLISGRAAAILGPYSTRCFSMLEAYVNDHPFFFLRERGAINCLNRERSVLEIFYPGEPDEIILVKRHPFDKSVIPDPCLFAIPEARCDLFGSDGIEELIRTNDLRGFRVVDAEAEII
jgi:hypothetical protein